MKINILIIFSIIILHTIACQQKDEKTIARLSAASNSYTTEPQLKKISTYKGTTDTIQIRLLMNKGNDLRGSAPDSALAAYRQAYYLSRKINYHRGTAVALLNIGELNSDKNGYHYTRAFYRRALPYCYLADVENEKSYLLPDVYNAMGNTYFWEANNDSAIQMYLQSLHIIEKRKIADTQRLIQAYNNMGSTLELMDEHYQRTLEYYYKALSLGFRYRKDTAQSALLFKNIGVIYGREENHDSALYCLDQALQLYKQLNASEDIREVYTNISDIWLHKNNMTKGRLYLDSAINTDKTGIGNSPAILSNMAHIYYHLGDLEHAVLYTEKALPLYDKKGRKEKLGLYVMLARMYDTLGNGHLAFHYAKAYAQLKDSILDEDKVKSLNLAEIKYRTSEKNKELAQKQLLISQQQNKIQKQYLWIGAAIITIMLLLGVFYRKQHKATIAQLKANLAGEEKERLRMAAELHDGIVSKLSSVKMSFDALTPIGATNPMVDPNEFREALHLLEQSIVELRTTSQNLQPSILKKAGLLPALNIYCQKISKVSRIGLDFQIIGILPPLHEDFQLHVYRIIQELINNIVKHAQATQAWVQFNIHGDQLHITVEDNGIGINPGRLYQQNGIGWQNLQNRLKLLNGIIEVQIKNGTAIYLDFDLKHYKI